MERSKILCRLCLAQPQVSYSLMDENCAKILESLTSIKVDSNDSLPRRACLKCWLNLKLAYKIQQNFLEIDKKLRSMICEKEDGLTEHMDVPVSLELSEHSLDPFDETIDEASIKQEHFEVEHKIDPDNDTSDLNLELNECSIKVENLTQNEIIILCHTDDIDENVESEENIPENTSCYICGSTVKECSLIEHLRTHYNSRLECDECSTYCENIASYRKHIMLRHTDMQKYWVCKICSASFQYKPLYQIHIDEAHKTASPLKYSREHRRLFVLEDYKYDCPYCKRKFKSEARSLAHIKTHNKKECPICHIKITPSNFKVHVTSHDSQPVVCHLCGMTYKNQTSLRSHIYYTHSTRKYVCKYCKKVFKKGYDLPLHIKKEHTGEKDHVCDVCGKGFFTFHTLNTHKKMTHMKLRPFHCQYCKKNFSSKHSLTTHVRQHTNVTPYNCDVCGEGFRQNVSLKAHMKSKHNIVEEKKCACKVCGKKFGTEWAVLSHMRVH